jgi:hypothetical protein
MRLFLHVMEKHTDILGHQIQCEAKHCNSGSFDNWTLLAEHMRIEHPEVTYQDDGYVL